MKYPSDLSDKQRDLIKEYFLSNRGVQGFKPDHSIRDMMDAISYQNKTGCQWHYLPNYFPYWEAVTGYYKYDVFAKIVAENNISLFGSEIIGPQFCMLLIKK